jgi:hypothetical protein
VIAELGGLSSRPTAKKNVPAREELSSRPERRETVSPTKIFGAEWRDPEDVQ